MLSVLPFSFLFSMVLGFGTLFSLSSMHWLGIWAGLEINLIGFIPLLACQSGSSQSESTVKYFIIQAMGSSLLIFGSLVGFELGFSWDLTDAYKPERLSIALVLVASALILKMGAFPLHYWLPSVMSGLSWVSCLILITWQKVAPIFLMSSFFEANYVFWFAFILCLLGAGSSLIGGIGGIGQTQIRAILAYSSIGHLGWIMFSIVFSTWVFKMYFSIYILISVSMFLSLWALNINNMFGAKSLNQKLIISNLNILMLLMSLSGLPPLLGFISKLLVITTSIMHTSFFILGFLILGALMSLTYYLSLFFSLYLDTIKSDFESGKAYINGLWFNSVNAFIMVLNLLGVMILIWMVSIELF